MKDVSVPCFGMWWVYEVYPPEKNRRSYQGGFQTKKEMMKWFGKPGRYIARLCQYMIVDPKGKFRYYDGYQGKWVKSFKDLDPEQDC